MERKEILIVRKGSQANRRKDQRLDRRRRRRRNQKDERRKNEVQNLPNDRDQKNANVNQP